MKISRLFRNVIVCALSLLLMTGAFSNLTAAQVSTTSRISGTVKDPQGAVVASAEVVVKNNEAGTEYKLKVGEDGSFVIPGLPAGTYTVTASAQGFKQTTVTNVKTGIGQTSTVPILLEVGAANEIITVTSGAEVLQKETTNVGSTIAGRQITELPFTSRDALDLVLMLPGTATPGRPRSSSVNGLPKGALNISIDGINVQDNTNRSGDGFFTYIRPRIDAIEEAQVSTATPGAEASAGGAVHIRFVTKAGTNEYHGGAWWYNRQRFYNANYYFNNLNGVERAQVMLNQYGFKAGGPITPWLKDKAFFFVSYDEFRLPEQQTRTRSLLSPSAERGIFKYPGGPAAGVDLLALVASRNIAGAPGTIDPTIARLLGDIRSSTSAGSLKDQSDPNFQNLTFTNTGGQTRRFPTLRVDFNVTSKHHLEAIYNYQDFAGKADFLNNVDPAFPAPVVQLYGGQASDRFSFSTALRSQLSATMVNEARFGLTGGTVLFFANVAAGDYDYFGGIQPVFPLTSNPFTVNNNSRRNAPIQQFTDNLSWTKGRHNLNFGVSYNHSSFFQQSSSGPLVPSVSFGINSTDPVVNAISTTTLPGADTTQVNNARALYAMLTGRISGVNFNAKLNEESKTYSLDQQAVERNSAKSYGFYFQDYFKFRSNLSLNYGLRWEAVIAPSHDNGVYVRPTFNGLFGISGPGNLFKPGARDGAVTTYVPVSKDDKPYKNDMNNFAPSLGFAWTPQFKNGLLKTLFGEADRTVIRSAYAISYVTGGFGDFTGIWNANPGLSKFAGLRAGVDFPSGSLLLRNGPLNLPTPPQPTYPAASSPGISANDFDPNLRTPYVQSWTFGLQRELWDGTVFEARYVGNHSVALVRTLNLNEVNIFESGFLQEFIAAQNNLAISVAAGRGNNFSNQGLAGQVALPIFQASFGSATSTQFANASFLDSLRRGEAGRLAVLIGNNSSNIAFQNNRIAAGLAPNLFTVNPSVYGAVSNFQTNGGSSTYNALQVELRRRMTNGFMYQGSYTFSKSLANPNSFGVHTLRDQVMDRGRSNFDLTHAGTGNHRSELPFGAGHKWDYKGPGNVIGKLIEGWQTDGIVRWQSGRIFTLTSGRQTVNGAEAGVKLVGIDQKQLQKLVGIYKDPLASTRGTVFFLPPDFIESSLRAFGLRPGSPAGPHIAPPTTPGKFGSYIYLTGPSFFRADLSLVKKTRITEKSNVEMRIEALNAFNNINFLVGGSANAEVGTVGINSLTFGQTNFAYQDSSTTNDPGGRLLQLVLRINF